MKIKDIINGMEEKEVDEVYDYHDVREEVPKIGYNSCLNTKVSVDEMAMLKHIEKDFKHDKLACIDSLELLLIISSIARAIKEGKIIRKVD